MPSPRQNGTAPGVPGAGRDDDAVAGDLLDPPGAGPQQEGLAGPRLVDHLLVELADAPPVREMDAVETAVGDRARVGDSELAGAWSSAHRPLGAIPDDSGSQLGEALGGIAAVEHVEDVLELLAGELGEGLRRADQLLDLVDLPLIERGHRDQVLGKHVERVLRDDRLLDLTGPHPAGDDGALEQVGPELGEDAALRDLAQRVAGSAHSLESPRHRLRRLDLDDEVHGAHVDAELERGGGDQAGQLAGLEQLLDQRPLLVGERAVVGPGDLGRRLASILRVAGVLGGGQLLLHLVVVHLVEALGDSLGRPPVVDEDDGRVVLADQPQQLGIDRRPDRAGVGGGVERGLDRPRVDPLGGVLEIRGRGLAGVGPVAALVAEWARLDHVLDRHDDLQVQLLRLGGVDDLAVAPGTHQELADPLQRPLRRGEPDPLDRLVGRQVIEALHGQRQMRAPLRGGHGVDLVDDHRFDAGEDLPGLRADHQVERLRRGDQDVRRLAAHRAAL